MFQQCRGRIAGGDRCAPRSEALEARWVVVVRQICPGYNSAMKFRLLLEYDAQAGRWSAVFPDLPGCASAGDTEEEAVANAKEALALWFDSTA
jgi:predicted RNase H-like HicB family nuclease